MKQTQVAGRGGSWWEPRTPKVAILPSPVFVFVFSLFFLSFFKIVHLLFRGPHSSLVPPLACGGWASGFGGRRAPGGQEP